MSAKTQSELIEYIKRRPDLADYQVAKNMKCHGVRAGEVAAARAAMDSGRPAATVTPSRIRIRSLEDFRRSHDVPQKIRDRITGLKADGYVTEEELRQLCEVPVQGWRRNAELPEFSEHKLKIDGVTYWASKETIRAMKRITGRA